MECEFETAAQGSLGVGSIRGLKSQLSAPVTAAAVVGSPLRIAFGWTLAGNLIYYGCQWGMLSVLAKLGNPAIVGQFALGVAIAAPVFMFTNLQLRGVQATDSRSDFAFSDYFTLRCMATCVGLATVLAIVSFSRYDHQTSLIVVLVALAKVVESLSDVILGLMQKNERLDQMATSLALKGAASILVFTGAFWRFRSLIAAVAAMGLSWLLVFLTYDLPVARRAGEPGTFLLNTNIPILRQLTLLSLPLGFVMSLMSLNTNIPRYILEHYKGPSEFGIYASLAYMGTAASLVINALGQSTSARLSRMFANQQFRGFKSLLRKFVLLGISIGIFGVPAAALFGRCVLSLVYRPEYALYLNVLVVMVATTSVLAIASFLGYGMTAARSFKAPLIVISGSTLATILLSFGLIPRFGLMGAAFALLSGAVVQAFGFTVGIMLELKSARVEAQMPYASENLKWKLRGVLCKR